MCCHSLLKRITYTKSPIIRNNYSVLKETLFHIKFKKSKKSKAIIDYSDTEEEIEDGGFLDEVTEENKEEQVSDDSLGENA